MQCLGIIKSGKRCARNVKNSKFCWQHQKLQKIKTILTILPGDFFINLGSFLTYTDLVNAVVAKFPKNISTLKYYLSFKLQNVTQLNNILKIVPRLKCISLFSEDEIKNDEISSLITTLKLFKNLETLSLDFKEANYSFDWSGFTLKHLDLNTAVNVYDIVTQIPTLQYLRMLGYTEQKNRIIPNTLKSFETDGLIHSVKLPYLKEFVVSYVDFPDMSYFFEFKELESLTIETPDDDHFLSNDNLFFFPNWIRYLSVEYIGYNKSVFAKLQLPVLEYLKMENLGSLQYIFASLFTYPKLTHLFIRRIKFRRFNDTFIKNLTELKKQKPALTFDFDTTQYEKAQKDLLNFNFNRDDLTQDQIQELYLDEVLETSNRQKEEMKLQEKYWPQLQKIFEMADLVKDKNGYYYLEKLQYTSLDWHKDNGYYFIPC